VKSSESTITLDPSVEPLKEIEEDINRKFELMETQIRKYRADNSNRVAWFQAMSELSDLCVLVQHYELDCHRLMGGELN
jgi:hypothetical protein